MDSVALCIFKGFNELGGLLKPTVASQNQSLPSSRVPPNKLVSDDLDSSLANLVGSKYIFVCKLKFKLKVLQIVKRN